MAKIWPVEAIKNHLLAIREAVQADAITALSPDPDGRLAAYRSGSITALKYLTERFGVSLNGAAPARSTQTAELRLRTWTRDDIKHILQTASAVLQQEVFLHPESDARVMAYYQGVGKTISSVALSFGIRDLENRR